MELFEDIRVFLIGETSFYYLDEDDKKDGWMLFESENEEQCIRICPTEDGEKLSVDMVVDGVILKGDGVIYDGGIEITSIEEFENEFFLKYFCHCYVGKMLK